MIEQSQRHLVSPSASDVDSLQRRANRRSIRQRSASVAAQAQWQQVRTTLLPSGKSLHRVPARFLLHTFVALVLPLAIVLSQVQPGTLVPVASEAESGTGGDFVVPMAPLSLDAPVQEGDAPLEDDAEMPMPISLISRSEALAPVVVSATVAAERIMLRNGPGTNYDAVARLSSGTKLQVIGRYGDWFQIRESVEKPVYWVSGELLDIPAAAVYTLFDVAEDQIPAPPPPKVGVVREEGLQLRDGPGTNYVSMSKLTAGQQIELLERYEDWFHVGIPNSGDGWVRGDFLNVEQSVLDRLITAESIPDPNPALVGTISENQVNLRKGPDSRYARVTMADAGLQVDLIGKNKDWYQVRLSDGTKAWIFSDFLNATSHVLRRVPVSNDFAALPKAVTTSSSASSSSGGGNSAELARVAASGDAASFALNFVGSRYRWGGSSPAGFDCSGLTSYVYRQVAGISLPRSAASQYSTRVGAQVNSISSLAPGDLVFFTRTDGRRGITHVALYVGGGRMVHAMSPRYGVQVSSIYDSYWTSRFYGGIRPRR